MKRTSDCLIVSPDTLPPPCTLHLPHHSDSWEQNSSDSFCCFSFSKLPLHLHHPSLVPLTVVIGSAGIIQRLDIIYCLPCTIPPPSHPFLNCTRCPADELIILEILFLLLIPPFYEQLLFYGAIDLTPAWSHLCQHLQVGRQLVWAEGPLFSFFFVVYCLLCIFPPSFSFLLSEIKH